MIKRCRQHGADRIRTEKTNLGPNCPKKIVAPPVFTENTPQVADKPGRASLSYPDITMGSAYPRRMHVLRET